MIKSTKICSACRLEKELSQFDKNCRSTDGYNNQCKVCRRLYYKNNKVKTQEYGKQYRLKNKERLTELKRIYINNNSTY
jgi:hypothetical protein